MADLSEKMDGKQAADDGKDYVEVKGIKVKKSLLKRFENKKKKDDDETPPPPPPFDMPCLYGCPTAKDLPGAVPDCMLATFDGYKIKEL
ncbi:MAG: hypothetical protein LUG49_05320 [Oscillospiraceae bacterium]|nr:hypothetical protein [Oscillospiraceae bacterium]